MKHFDRCYNWPGYKLATSGYHAVLFMCEQEDGKTWVRTSLRLCALEQKDVNDAMLEVVKRWQGALPKLAPVDADALKRFVLIDCPLCKNERTTECKACGGTGREDRRCTNCDERHDCICRECTQGRRRCSCAKDSPVRIGGDTFNKVLVDDLLRELGEPPERMGLVDTMLVMVTRSVRIGAVVRYAAEYTPNVAVPVFEQAGITR